MWHALQSSLHEKFVRFNTLASCHFSLPSLKYHHSWRRLILHAAHQPSPNQVLNKNLWKRCHHPRHHPPKKNQINTFYLPPFEGSLFWTSGGQVNHIPSEQFRKALSQRMPVGVSRGCLADRRGQTYVIHLKLMVCLKGGIPGKHTSDGRNPAPPLMYKTLLDKGINYLTVSTGAGFLPSTVLL